MTVDLGQSQAEPVRQRLKVLLFAYEFPPILAAQSLRWYYLCNELARVGVEVDVLAPSIRDVWGFVPRFEDGVTVHRCFPGPFVGLAGWLARLTWDGARRGGPTGRSPAPGHALLNRGKGIGVVYGWIRRGLDWVVFPDLRSEWLPFAWRAAKHLQQQVDYDLVISSHEPGVDLLLGLRARKAWCLPWIVDLADPLVAPYTPKWRRRRDLELERRVCESADAVLVTNETVADQLAARHGLTSEKFVLVRQGFDASTLIEVHRAMPRVSGSTMLMVYTGTFYAGFRDPTPLVDALSRVDGVQMIFIGDVGPFRSSLNTLGDVARVLGKLSHLESLAWQRQADVLINLGNRHDEQVPGKIYEYLGAGRPILHVASSESDPVIALLERLRRGKSVPADAVAIAGAIARWRELWQLGQLDVAFDLSKESVAEFSWTSSAAKVKELASRLLEGRSA